LAQIGVVKEGDRISGKYRLLRLLAEGGMGEVWAARNEYTDRRFAIKVLLPHCARSSNAVRRFVREARATGRIHHPNLVSVLDAGCTDDGRPYLVMELLGGESLEQRLAREGTLSQLSACVVFAQVARALSAAHHAGLVHRDLSSGNVFLVPAERASEPVVKLLDFGVSKIIGPQGDGNVLTATGAMLGSLEYMSPEQACGAESVDARTDVWSLGVLMYEALTGTRPFEEQNYRARLYAILQSPHRPLHEARPGLDPELCEVVESCLVKDRRARASSARWIADQLEQIAWRLATPGAEHSPAVRRRATDRLSSTPRERSSVRPSLATTGMPSKVLPVGVRWWQRFDTMGSARQVIALSCALVGAVVGVVLGHLMADVSSRPDPTRPSVAEIWPGGRESDASKQKLAEQVEAPVTAAATPAEPPTSLSLPPAAMSLVKSVALGLGVGRDAKRPDRKIAVSRVKPARDSSGGAL